MIYMSNNMSIMVVICAMQGHLPVVEYLCKASADVNQGNKSGATPLFIVAQKVSM